MQALDGCHRAFVQSDRRKISSFDRDGWKSPKPTFMGTPPLSQKARDCWIRANQAAGKDLSSKWPEKNRAVTEYNLASLHRAYIRRVAPISGFMRIPGCWKPVIMTTFQYIPEEVLLRRLEGFLSDSHILIAVLRFFTRHGIPTFSAFVNLRETHKQKLKKKTVWSFPNKAVTM